MDFFTPVELPSGLPPLVQADSLLLMGSCFATNMGSLLADAKFHPDINPFGVLYNPLSISAALREVVAGKVYKEENLFFFRECWHSPMHHGDFSSPSMEETLQRINTRLVAAHECIQQHVVEFRGRRRYAVHPEQRNVQIQQPGAGDGRKHRGGYSGVR